MQAQVGSVVASAGFAPRGLNGGNITLAFCRADDSVSGTYVFTPGPHGPALTGRFEVDSAGLKDWAAHARRAFPSAALD